VFIMPTGNPLVIGIAVSILAELVLAGKDVAGPAVDENSRPADVSNSAPKRLFERNCSSCHGKDGSGARARTGASVIPDFTNASWHAKRSDKALKTSISEGKGTRMPSFGELFTENEIEGLITVIRKFAPEAKQPRSQREKSTATESDDFIRRFLDLQKQMDDLNRQLRDLPSRKPPPPDRQ
jgi:mono/diheme cytochrome c family protein